MAWALHEPNVGKFVVLGEYCSTLNDKEIPRKDRLGHAWDHEMTEEEKGYPGFHGRRDSYISANYRKFGAATNPAIYGPILDHEKPDIYVLHKPKKTILPFSFIILDLHVVDQQMLEIILALEPEANPYWPIQIRTKRGKVYDGPLYALAVTQSRDAFLLEETEYEFREISSTYMVLDWGDKPGKMTISKARQDGAHLWREKNFLGPRVLMSDQMHEALKAAGVPLPKMFKVEEMQNG